MSAGRAAVEQAVTTPPVQSRAQPSPATRPALATPTLLPNSAGRPAMGKRYRWRIEASDRYLWALGGAGNAPLPVNFGSTVEPPPSAPKQDASKKQRVEAKAYERADAGSEVPAPAPGGTAEVEIEIVSGAWK